MSNDDVPKLESVDEEYIEIESENESNNGDGDSETISSISDDESTIAEKYLLNPDELENDDFDDEYMEDETFGLDNMGALLGSVLTNEEGETVCSALVNISRQLEVQNKIMIKMLAQLQKRV